MKDLRQTSQYTKYMHGLGWIVFGKPGNFAYIKKLPLVGHFIKFQRPSTVDSSFVKQLINKYKPFQVVVEPLNKYQVSVVKNLGFKQSKSYFVPSKTIQIDLTKSENQLMSEMHYKTRYNIKKAMISKLETIKSKDIESFASFWQKCALLQRGMYLSQKQEILGIFKSFGGNAHIITVKKNGTVLSGILLICTKKVAYYMFAASTDEGKKLFAPTLNVWEAVKLARKMGCKFFDFEGVYDNRFPIRSWLGFTRFKKSFGGIEVEYPGAFIKLKYPILKFLSV